MGMRHVLSVTQGHMLRGPHHGDYSAITILKLLLILNKGALHFHFALSLQITVVCPDHKF